MNNIKELVSHGISEATAIKMLNDYQKRIGTMNGVYKIIDINYDFNECGRDITLQCSECGKIIHRMMIQGRNKWSELIKPARNVMIVSEKINLKNPKNGKKMKFFRISEKHTEIT